MICHDSMLFLCTSCRLQVGVVLSTEAVPKKDKLLLLSVDVGNEVGLGCCCYIVSY